jgi:hypothetical protein
MIIFRKAGRRRALALATAAASLGLAAGLAGTAAAATAAPATSPARGHIELCARGNYEAFLYYWQPGAGSGRGTDRNVNVPRGKCTSVAAPREPDNRTGIVLGGYFPNHKDFFYIAVAHVNVPDGVALAVAGTNGNNGNDASAHLLKQNAAKPSALAGNLATTAPAVPANGPTGGHLDICARGNYIAAVVAPNIASPYYPEAAPGQCADDFLPKQPNNRTTVLVFGYFNQHVHHIFFIGVEHVNIHDGATVAAAGTTGNEGNDASAYVLKQNR